MRKPKNGGTMKEEHFKFKKSYYNLIKEMTDKQAGEFIKGISTYVFCGRMPITKDKFLKGAFLLFQKDYQEQKRNALNGRKGGIISAELRSRKESEIIISMHQETICPASEYFKTLVNEEKGDGESVAKSEKK